MFRKNPCFFTDHSVKILPTANPMHPKRRSATQRRRPTHSSSSNNYRKASTRWLVSAAFGLVHGFGFSFLLQSELQFAGEHLLLSLLAFNVGIELGQLAFIAVVIPLLALAISRLRLSEAVVTVAVSVFVGHAAWHWLVERWETLAKAQWPQPEPLEMGLWLVLAAALAALARALLRRPAVVRGRDAEAGVEPH